MIIVGNLNLSQQLIDHAKKKNQCAGPCYDNLSKPGNYVSKTPFYYIMLGYR